MKKGLLILAATLMVVAGLMSCSKKEQAAPARNLPPDHKKVVEEMRKGAEQSKTLVVADVNGEKISMNDLIREMNVIAPSLVRPGEHPTPRMDEEIRTKALDALVFGALATQEAKRQGLAVKPEAVNEAVRNLKDRAGSQKAYEAYLASQGLTEADFRTMVIRDILYRQITEKEILKKVKNIKPGEKQLKEIYAREKNSFVMPEAYVAEDVFFVSGKKDERTMEKAKKVLDEIKAKGNDLSKLTHDDGFIVRKIPVSQGVFPNIYKVLGTLKRGDVSGIIEEADGLHIVKAEGKEPARPMTFDEAKHIIEQELTNAAIEKRKNEWEKELKKNAKIEITLKGKEGIEPVY